MWIRDGSRGDNVLRRAVLGVRLLGRSLVAPVLRWERRQATIRALSALDDRMLADIGISRSEIEQVAHGRFPNGAEPLAASSPRRPEPAREMRKAA